LTGVRRLRDDTDKTLATVRRSKSRQIEELEALVEPAFGHLDNFMPAPLLVFWAIVHEEQIPLCPGCGRRPFRVSRKAQLPDVGGLLVHARGDSPVKRRGVGEAVPRFGGR
jgi:hypothetical protein